jgi:DNA-binding GntR family transcriptional regulator
LTTPRTRKPSLVDSAEQALRDWLAPGRHRLGDRLPPEHDLASMLGVSRGTLRTALERLESSGEIVRRQGSGTFVGPMTQPTALEEGLERLEPYSSLARARGVKLGVRDLCIETVALEREQAQALGVPEGTAVTRIGRTLLADGSPAAVMVDAVHPDMPLPPTARLRRAMERGDMVMDVLLSLAVPIAFANTRIRARQVTPREREAKALGVTRTTAVLELEETLHLASGEVTHLARDLFAPEGLDLHVVRWLEAARPVQVRAG